MKYLLRGTLNKIDAPELYAPREKAYEILKGAVVGGPGLMLCRKRESVRTSSNTRRRVQEFWPTTPARCIQAQWRSLRNGRKRQGTSKTLSKFCRETDGLDSPRWTSRCQESYGRNAAIVLKQTRSNRHYTVAHERLLGAEQTQTHARPMKTGCWLPFSPEDPTERAQLKWYLYRGLKITTVHRTIDYVPQKIFTFFVNKVTENGRKDDKNPKHCLPR